MSLWKERNAGDEMLAQVNSNQQVTFFECLQFLSQISISKLWLWVWSNGKAAVFEGRKSSSQIDKVHILELLCWKLSE